MRFAILLLVACESAGPPPPPANVAATPTCDRSHARTHEALARAGVTASAARPFERCLHGWSIALDTVCRVPAVGFDNTDARVTLLGRWIVIYEPGNGTELTFAPRSYTGYTSSSACISYEHPGNIASDDPARLVDAVLGDLPDGGVTLVERHRVLQDHPELAGLSLVDMPAITFRLHAHAPTIDAIEVDTNR